jgi:two-component system, NarL family, nitrate/nitrite response regulator NarL
MEVNETYTIHICDDHALITSGLSQILQEAAFVNRVFISNSKDELLYSLSKKPVDLLVLDISIHGLNMLDEVCEIQEKFPALKIILLTSYASIDVQREAMAKKINGFLSKDSSNQHILYACQEVLKGNQFWLSERSIAFKDSNSLINPEELTPREKEILKLLVKGYTNQKIADSLIISIHTVQTHRKNIKSKLQLEGVSDLISYAHHHKLI